MKTIDVVVLFFILIHSIYGYDEGKLINNFTCGMVAWVGVHFG